MSPEQIFENGNQLVLFFRWWCRVVSSSPPTMPRGRLFIFSARVLTGDTSGPVVPADEVVVERRTMQLARIHWSSVPFVQNAGRKKCQSWPKRKKTQTSGVDSGR